MIKKYLEFIRENKQEKQYNSKNLIEEICCSMVLLNNTFLDNLLDKGNKARYQENSQVFITDLKNLLLNKNRLVLGVINNGNVEESSEISQINKIFNDIEFSMENDWSKLINARITARNIIDKLLPDEKLTPERISKIYWLGPNKEEGFEEDIVIELTDGKKYSIFLNKNMSLQKTASFNSFAEDLIGLGNLDKLYNEENIKKWDKLTQEWVRIVYENSNKSIQNHIEKFIDTKRIDSIGYFEYFDIRHRDPKFKYLGEYIKEFEKNILKFSDLMNEVWKNREIYFSDVERVEKEWNETRIVILNSRILEHLFTTSLKSEKPDDVIKLDSEYKQALGDVKMKIIKTIVEKLDCLEKPVYYLSSNGNTFYHIPSREFFRKNYESIDIQFDYHVNFEVSDEDDNNKFNMKIKMILNDIEIIKMNVIISFTSGEFSGKLNAKYKFEFADNFNYLISKKENEEDADSNI
jgi:hypothetical protein